LLKIQNKTVIYDKVPETKKPFSLFSTVFAIWNHLEAFIETILEAFGSLTVFADLSFQCQNGAK
jgi:hypothetical protein